MYQLKTHHSSKRKNNFFYCISPKQKEFLTAHFQVDSFSIVRITDSSLAK